MTCRHRPGDPSCSTKNPEAMAKRARADYDRWVLPTTPDSKRFQILDAAEEKSSESVHLILKVKYPNCEKCSYEGIKIMVFRNCTSRDALFWTEIDPHFSDPKEVRAPNQAPSPAARFPASDTGWNDAIYYARSLGKKS